MGYNSRDIENPRYQPFEDPNQSFQLAAQQPIPGIGIPGVGMPRPADQMTPGQIPQPQIQHSPFQAAGPYGLLAMQLAGMQPRAMGNPGQAPGQVIAPQVQKRPWMSGKGNGMTPQMIGLLGGR